jgi:hypothetical protein
MALGINKAKLTIEQLEKVAEWLKEEGQNIINEVSETESETETDNYIKNMSVIEPEKLKTPYNI